MKKSQALASVSKLIKPPSQVPKDLRFDSSPFLSLSLEQMENISASEDFFFLKSKS